MAQSKDASSTLHRSDVHTQSSADPQETKARQQNRKNRRGHDIRRGRVPFKELGKVVKVGEIAEMTRRCGYSYDKVTRQSVTIAAAESGHRETSRKKGDGEGVMEYANSGAKDAELLDGEKPEEDLDEDQAQQPHMTLENGLFGKDLPRCTGRDKATDGFRMLREFVCESENRVTQVKSFVPGTVYGLDYKVSMLDYLMPPRSDYPPAADKRALSARGSVTESNREKANSIDSSSMPQSARAVLQGEPAFVTEPDEEFDENEIKPPSEPRASKPTRPAQKEFYRRREAERKARHCPGRPANPQAYHRQVYVSPVQSEMRPRPLPIRLPSLANFIAKSEPAMGGRSERGEHSHQRETINELLGLDKDKVLKHDTLATQDASGGIRRGKLDIKRRIEKQCDVAWADKVWLKRLLASQDRRPEDSPAPGQPGSGAAGASDAAGAAGAEEASAGHDGGQRRKREWTEAEEAEAYAKFVALLREPDPTISPLARLRSTLAGYQETRDKNKGHLQSALYSMDADRLNSLKRRAQHLQLASDGPDAKTSCALMRLESERDMLTQHIQDRMKKQYLWYRDLWHHVRGDKRDLPKVAHFIFDFVKQVLEYGEVFNKEMYFAMLEKIENYEFSSVIAGLVVGQTMIGGIEDLTMADIIMWFRENRRGEVPPAVQELTGKEKVGPDLGDASDIGSPSTRSKSKGSLTFVAEALN